MGRPVKAKVADTKPDTSVKVFDDDNVVLEEPAKAPDFKETEEAQEDKRTITLMKLYPQYESFYVTPEGFVHPENTPEYLRHGAKLIKNKFYNK